MILAIDFEIKNIESQPEWIDLNSRVSDLVEKLSKATYRFDENPNNYNQKRCQILEKEIDFFRNIITFWKLNYNNLQSFKNAVVKQIGAINKGHDLLMLIEDLKIARKLEEDTQKVLSDSFIQLAESKGMDIVNMKKSLQKLHDQVNKHWKHINFKVDEQAG